MRPRKLSSALKSLVFNKDRKDEARSRSQSPSRRRALSRGGGDGESSSPLAANKSVDQSTSGFSTTDNSTDSSGTNQLGHQYLDVNIANQYYHQDQLDQQSPDHDDDSDRDEVYEDGLETGSARRIDFDDASSIIGGHSFTREEQQAAELEAGVASDHESEHEHQKTFSFSLPFGNPLANLELRRLSKFFNTSGTQEDAQETADRLETINSHQEEELFGDIRQQDNSRMRAVRHALTPSINNPLSPKPDGFPQIDGDVVVMGGYRGSILRDCKTGRRVWIPIRVGLNMRKIDLTVGINDEDEYEMEKHIKPDGMLTHIGPVDVSRKLIRKLQAQPRCQVHEFAYDWRLSSDINSKKLREYIHKRTRGRKVIVIAHSMGGLIAHHAMTQEPELFGGIVYAGVPSACPNILGPLRYGDSILLSSKILTAQVNFLMRSSFAFLPLDGKCFVDRNTNERYDLDFFDVNTWTEYGLSPCVAESTEIRKTQTGSEPVSDQERFQLKKHTDTFVYPTSEVIPYDQAVSYLDRTLKRTKAFLESLEYDPEKEKSYPPMAVLYGCTVPTLKGARVDGKQGIKDGNYNDLVFGAGDGVIYHKSLMPIGRGFDVCAKIPSDRGHVSLLNDIDGIGRALSAVLDARRMS